jgi:hypothetical protein
MKPVRVLFAAMTLIGCLCASSSNAYQLLEHHFDVTPLRADIYNLIRCDDGRVLKIDPNANPYEACQEGPYARKKDKPTASNP